MSTKFTYNHLQSTPCDILHTGDIATYALAWRMASLLGSCIEFMFLLHIVWCLGMHKWWKSGVEPFGDFCGCAEVTRGDSAHHPLCIRRRNLWETPPVHVLLVWFNVLDDYIDSLLVKTSFLVELTVEYPSRRGRRPFYLEAEEMTLAMTTGHQSWVAQPQSNISNINNVTWHNNMQSHDH